jgi:hypothetical protein
VMLIGLKSEFKTNTACVILSKNKNKFII